VKSSSAHRPAVPRARRRLPPPHPDPVAALRPPATRASTAHRPQLFHGKTCCGSSRSTRPTRANTVRYTVLNLARRRRRRARAPPRGIHWHVASDMQLAYVAATPPLPHRGGPADRPRRPGHHPGGGEGSTVVGRPVRTRTAWMPQTRPTHIYLSPTSAVRRLTCGEIPTTIPWIRKEAAPCCRRTSHAAAGRLASATGDDLPNPTPPAAHPRSSRRSPCLARPGRASSSRQCAGVAWNTSPTTLGHPETAAAAFALPQRLACARRQASRFRSRVRPLHYTRWPSTSRPRRPSAGPARQQVGRPVLTDRRAQSRSGEGLGTKAPKLAQQRRKEHLDSMIALDQGAVAAGVRTGLKTEAR